MTALAIVTLIPLTASSQDSIKVPVKVFDYMATEGVKSNMYYQDNVNLSAINMGLNNQLKAMNNMIKEYKSVVIDLSAKEEIYTEQIADLNKIIDKQKKKIVQNKVLLWTISAVSASVITYVALRR